MKDSVYEVIFDSYINRIYVTRAQNYINQAGYLFHTHLNQVPKNCHTIGHHVTYRSFASRLSNLSNISQAF